MTDQRKKALRRRLQEARLRLLHRDFDFAEPLLQMQFVATKEVRRISTNGACIYFDPAWLSKLSDFALDFALAHQLMHIRLEHTSRSMLFQGDRYHLACDIVANARLRSYGLGADSIPGLGKIYTETFFPRMDGQTLTAEAAFDFVPFDPAMLKKAQRDRYILDDESWWSQTADRGETGELVLSPEDDDPEDLVCRVEYRTVIRKHKKLWQPKELPQSNDLGEPAQQYSWDKAAAQSIQSLRSHKNRSKQFAEDALSGLRYWHPLSDSRLDWREILHTFLQDAQQDYTFTPPDRRYDDSGFFLPDFNHVPGSKEVLFYVDTSESVRDETLSQVASEICGAIGQFQNQLEGTLIFFDTVVYPEAPFRTAQDIRLSVPDGGGGTDFRCVFQHAARKHLRKSISSMVIFSDGEGTYPKDWKLNIPVLWVINNQNTTPPFGTVARM